MARQPKALLTPEEYLEMDRAAEVRHEYYYGEIFAMAGGSFQHSALKARLTGMLFTELKGNACRTFESDLRICVDAANHYTYADVFLICGPLQLVGDRSDII